MCTRRERILQKLNPKLLKMTPKLSGDSGSFIDLDSDDTLEDGAKKLMMRFLRNQDLREKNKRNLMQNETKLTVSSVEHDENNEICEIISERLTLPFLRNDEDDVSDRPGKSLQKLKNELQEKMSAKWEEEYKKRVSANKVYSESSHKQKKYSEDDDEDGDEDGDVEGNNNGVNSSIDNDSNKEKTPGDEGEVVTEEIDEQNSDDEFGDDEEESDGASVVSEEQNNEDGCKDNDNDHEEDDECHLSDSCSLVPAYQPGGGMLYGGSELTQCDEGLPHNLLSPSLRLSMSEISGSKLSSEDFSEATPKKTRVSPNKETENLFMEKNKLFSQVPNDSFDLNEAFEFCSGKFPESGSQLPSQNTVEENCQDGDKSDKDKLENSFEEDLSSSSQPNDADNEKETPKTRKNIITYEDSEAEEELETENDINLADSEEFQSAGPKLLSDNEDEDIVDDEKIKKKKKRRTNLHFSDEEDAASNCEDEKENVGDDSDVSEKEDDEDEEQRSVHYDSEENEIINPREFFEKEAELSGSEWSGDEDEKDLDEFDVEEGDADKLDSDQVRSQLEKIHIRRVLDDDAREVRLIQEILFEDGDLHSDGKRRDRKFKWKNLGTFDEEKNEGEAKEDGGNSSEDDGAEDEEMRKIRHEKELFLKTKKKEGDLSSDEEIVEDFHAIKVTSVKTSLKLPSSGQNAVENSKNITDYTRIAKTSISQNVRGSFLTRNEQFLSRLAKATSGVTDNVLGPKSSKNFVFTTKSPEKKNPDRNTVSKRQMEDAGTCRGRDKRIKVLPPEIETGPSILDFLV